MLIVGFPGSAVRKMKREAENENGTTTNNNNNNSKGGRSVLENASLSDGFVPVTPGETWREILLQSGENDTFAWLFSLHEAMHSPNGVAQNSADGSSAILPGTKVAKETRSLLSNFCALSGSIFPEADVHKHLKSMHFQRCVQSLLKTRTVVDPKDAMINIDEEEEVLDCVKQLGTLCSAHNWTFLVARARLGGSVLEALTSICLAAIEGGSLCDKRWILFRSRHEELFRRFRGVNIESRAESSRVTGNGDENKPGDC